MTEANRRLRLDGAATLTVALFGITALVAAVAFAYVPPNVPATCGTDCADNLDLIAQTNMASAAWFMAAMAAVGTLASLITLVIIVLTLGEAKRSADAGDRVVDATLFIGKRQVRAYLNVENASLKLDESWIFLDLTCSLRNAGQSPAKYINASAVMEFIEYHNRAEDNEVQINTVSEFRITSAAPDMSAGQNSDIIFRYVVLNTDPSIKDVFDGYKVTNISATVTGIYEDVFGERHEFRCKLSSAIATVEKLEQGVQMRVGSDRS